MFVAIQASNDQQACRAAEMLGLPVPDGRRHGAGDVIAWFVDRPEQVMSLQPDRVVFVDPRLENTIVDQIRHQDCRTWLRERFLRKLIYSGEMPSNCRDLRAFVDSKIEYVTT
jgi:hypothetical protein